MTVLDPSRLQLLEQERGQLKDVEAQTDPAKKTAQTQQLAGTIYNELDYAGTQQATPDPDALAGTLRMRAPNDPTFNTAVDAAVAKYKADLAAQGRTADQIGQIDAAAKSGDWNKVRQLTAQQVAATAGKDQGSKALGDMTARGGVYLTYAGGDPQFAASVKQGIDDAQKQVMIDRPIASVQDSYSKGGSAAAMKALNQITDPQTMTPGQVAQIMSDSRIQTVVKDSLKTTSWGNSSAIGMMSDLQAACQHAVEADQGHPGLGKQAVDQIAQSVIDRWSDMSSTPQLMDSAPLPFQILENGAGSGNVALALALAVAVAANTPQGDPNGIQSTAISAATKGIDEFSASVTSLNGKTAQDAQFIGVPLQDWGGNSTPQEQTALVQKLLSNDPDKAKTLNQDGLDELQKQAQYNKHAHSDLDVLTRAQRHPGL